MRTHATKTVTKAVVGRGDFIRVENLLRNHSEIGGVINCVQIPRGFKTHIKIMTTSKKKQKELQELLKLELSHI